MYLKLIWRVNMCRSIYLQLILKKDSWVDAGLLICSMKGEKEWNCGLSDAESVWFMEWDFLFLHPTPASFCAARKTAYSSIILKKRQITNVSSWNKQTNKKSPGITGTPVFISAVVDFKCFPGAHHHVQSGYSISLSYFPRTAAVVIWALEHNLHHFFQTKRAG